jgi:aminoglycoside/choline kinase family phosphotransferase/GTP:adenosylcobinamide-phosphate guanylyltransferase
MKAMILAAGFGTRLLPYTRTTPKALFTIGERPVLDLAIRQLIAAGCRSVIVNTHHLHDQIEDFLSSQRYTIPVQTSFEPEILGTGGAVKKTAYFWDDQPFMVINSDILTDIDLQAVYRFHLGHPQPVTLVLHDEPLFNSVSVASDDLVQGFGSPTGAGKSEVHRLLAFTGIQVLDPMILDLIPEKAFHSSIDTYREIIANGGGVRAYVSTGHYWTDIGTPESYRRAVRAAMDPLAFNRMSPGVATDRVACEQLAGDGSDRRWYRLKSDTTSLVMVDHGIRNAKGRTEADAFVAIGRHLFSKGVPVPKIILYDRFAGLVYLEDVGNTHLQDVIQHSSDPATIIPIYRQVIRRMIAMSQTGAEGFEPSWTYQTPTYSRELILEKECRYFTDAFLSGYLDLPESFAELEPEFSLLADGALDFACDGFMHRDFQSRNIMLRDGEIFIIDFQGGRQGPLQYDLASLLNDPYVNLPEAIQSELVEYCIQQIDRPLPDGADSFRRGYHYCALTRNLQVLGAFAFLSRTKGKKQFEAYIPTAAQSLHRRLTREYSREFPRLTTVAEKIQMKISKPNFP